jgi:hypothetical protein
VSRYPENVSNEIDMGGGGEQISDLQETVTNRLNSHEMCHSWRLYSEVFCLLFAIAQPLAGSRFSTSGTTSRSTGRCSLPAIAT